MRNNLVEETLKKIVHPEILVNMVSKRVRQLGQGFRPLIAVGPKMTFMDVALKEIAEGKLTFEVIEEPKDTSSGKKNKKKPS